MMLHEHLPMLAKFVILLTGVLLLPRLMEQMRLPGVLGYILAGVLIGPPLLGVVKSNSMTINFFAEIGKLLFMFFVGFEVDMEQFNLARKRCLTFGALTFVLPFAGGLFLARLTGYEWNASVLIGSVIASHTLLGFPLLTRLGLVRRESVLVAVGGTIITDIAAMMVLAVTISIHQIGFSWQFLLIELLELAVFVPLIIFGLSKISRKAVIRYGQSPEARMVIFMMVISVAAELGQMIHLEGIVGAFLAGIAVKRSFRGKFALEQLEVIAQSLFIPAFFVSTGFLVDFALLGNTIVGRPALVFGLIGMLVFGKTIAAWITSKSFGYTGADTGLITSLTLPQMAATLASAVVAHQALNAAGEPLIDSMFVNATLVLVVISCIAGPILTQRYGNRIVSQAADAAKPPAA
jgi:Kef-type K+ transport system membrane component KefB